MAHLTEFICLLLISTIVAGDGFYNEENQKCSDGCIIDLDNDDDSNINLNTLACCKGKTYNYTTQRCCIDTVIENAGEDDSCCGRTKCNWNTDLCCIDTVYPKAGGGVSCCGRTKYNMNEELCCGDKLYEKLTPHYKCCGNDTMDGSRQACLNKRIIIDVKPEDLDDNKTFACGTDENNYTAYDKTESKCCGVKVHKLKTEDYSQCCGDEYFDYSASTRCCGETLYDDTKELCCYFDDNIPTSEPKVIPANNIYPNTTYSCCNYIAYQHESQICCKDGPRDAEEPFNSVCCGDQVINRTTHVCINGTVKNMEPDEFCCGEELYKAREKYCYNETILVEYGEGEYVCYSDGVKYNLTYQDCTTEGVKTPSNDEFNANKTTFCESNSYNYFD